MKLFRKRESNWETYSALDPMKKYQYRDVFKHQRLERADVEEAETMTSRLIALAVMTVGVFMLVWLVLSAAQMFGGGFANQLNRTSGQSSAQYADTGQAGQTGSGQDGGTAQDGGQVGQAQAVPGFDESGEVVAGEPTLREFQALQNSYFDPFREQYFVKTRSNSSLHQYFSKASGEEWNFNDIYKLWTEITRGNYAAYCALRNGFSGTDWADGSEGNYVMPAEWQAELAAESAGTESGGGDSSGAGSQSGGQQGSGTGFSLGSAKFGGVTLGECLRSVRPWKVFWSLFSTAIFALVMYFILKRNWEVQTAGKRTDDMNQWENDQHIQLVEEVQQNYDYFPDVGAHCPVQVASTISHVMLSNKGVKTVQLVRRTEKDIVDKDGETVYYKGEVLLDDDGEPIVDELPMFDKKFGLALFDSAKALDDKRVRVFYSPKDILYNDGDKNRDKLKGARTVADMINKYWHIPDYEPQRPAGAYLVDTAPVNTMVLAITRAGKGQTYIEPTLDMWTREDIPSNMVINDPKGELLVKFYVKGTVRGYQIVQFNLINVACTDVYNPLGLAAESAREGDFTKVAQYVDNIAEVFFPVDSSQDPVWPNAANNAFKRAAYGLIDYYLEQEKTVRLQAQREGWDDKTLETEVDRLWGKVTLYNCYQLFVVLAGKKLKNPIVEFKNREKAGDFEPLQPDEDPNHLRPGREPMDDAEFEEAKQRALQQGRLWQGKAEDDLLTLFFNATAELPSNSIRRLVANADNSLRSMGSAEKMLASYEMLFAESNKASCRTSYPANCMAEGRNDRVTPRNVLPELRRASGGNAWGAKFGKAGRRVSRYAGGL